ncbi:N-terminal domain of NEFA-interacting nuclear protein NIP30-domain-containing protein [Lipomyces orientalis]|uniref:N-terminal domain of NEFA-interacting nuclear protein NIP30-domain-containing protein n=1 Tax=Lipomyces orientalis TaxID=1233043 RepID=A0ACC3TWF6_9ASCO
MSSGFMRQTGSSPSSASNSVPVSHTRSGLGLPRQNQQEENRSLFDVLQENKAKKQADFEQSVAERNQLHRLDDDEIAFLEGLKERERRREVEVRDEVERGLQEFRERRRVKEAANKNGLENSSPGSSSADGMKDEHDRNEGEGTSISSSGLDLGLLKSRFAPASNATKEAEQQPENKKRHLDADESTDGGSGKKHVKILDKILARRKDNGKSSLLGKSLGTSIVKRKL